MFPLRVEYSLFYNFSSELDRIQRMDNNILIASRLSAHYKLSIPIFNIFVVMKKVASPPSSTTCTELGGDWFKLDL